MEKFTNEKIKTDITYYYEAEKIAKNAVVKAQNRCSKFDFNDVKKNIVDLIEILYILKGIEDYFINVEENVIDDESIDLFLSDTIHSIIMNIVVWTTVIELVINESSEMIKLS